MGFEVERGLELKGAKDREKNGDRLERDHLSSTSLHGLFNDGKIHKLPVTRKSAHKHRRGASSSSSWISSAYRRNTLSYNINRTLEIRVSIHRWSDSLY